MQKFKNGAGGGQPTPEGLRVLRRVMALSQRYYVIASDQRERRNRKVVAVRQCLRVILNLIQDLSMLVYPAREEPYGKNG